MDVVEGLDAGAKGDVALLHRGRGPAGADTPALWVPATGPPRNSSKYSMLSDSQMAHLPPPVSKHPCPTNLSPQATQDSTRSRGIYLYLFFSSFNKSSSNKQSEMEYTNEMDKRKCTNEISIVNPESWGGAGKNTSL